MQTIRVPNRCSAQSESQATMPASAPQNSAARHPAIWGCRDNPGLSSLQPHQQIALKDPVGCLQPDHACVHGPGRPRQTPADAVAPPQPDGHRTTPLRDALRREANRSRGNQVTAPFGSWRQHCDDLLGCAQTIEIQTRAWLCNHLTTL